MPPLSRQRIAAATSLLALVMVGGVGVLPSATAAAPAVTATPSTTSATPLDEVTVYGTASKSAPVVLQRKVAGEWGKVSSGTTNAGGAYTVNFPTNWYLDHRLRVLDTNTREASPVFTVNVHPDFEVKGTTKFKRLYDNNARWNPCKPITWRLNPKDGFPHQVEAFKARFTEMGYVTGFTYKYLGKSKKEVGDRRRSSHANILIDWKKPSEDRELDANTLGYAAPYQGSMRGAKQHEIYGADIVLNQTSFLLEDFDGATEQDQWDYWSWVLGHEIGHTIGLDHVKDKWSMMRASAAAYRPSVGDLLGFAALGAKNGCFKSVR